MEASLRQKFSRLATPGQDGPAKLNTKEIQRSRKGEKIGSPATPDSAEKFRKTGHIEVPRALARGAPLFDDMPIFAKFFLPFYKYSSLSAKHLHFAKNVRRINLFLNKLI